MIRKQTLQKGFTLVELLAVMAVLITVGTVVFGILVASLRGSSKSEILTDVTQNGNYALTEMTKTIRFAQTVEDPSPCYQGTPPEPVTASSITIRNVDNSRITYACTSIDGNDTIASNGASLLDTNAVSVTSCSFSCSQDTVYKAPSIGISFTLNNKGSNDSADNQAPLTFQTTVVLRNKN
jgi:type II secretory pathway pseudopilin PulG